MSEGRVDWDRSLLKIFLDLCVDEVHKCNCIKGRMNKEGWANLVTGMQAATGKSFKPKTLQNKFTSLRGEYIAWNKLKNKTGGGINPRTGCIDAPPHWWEEALSEIAGATTFKKRPLWFEDQMDTIFCETAAGTGDLLWPGADDVPARGVEEGPDDWADVTDTQGSGSQRAPRRNAVDSPSPKKKKKTFQDHQFKRFVDSFTESVKMKSSSSDGNRSEIQNVIELLRQDGLDEESDEFYHAADLLRDPSHRSVLLSLSGSSARLGWVRFHWNKHSNP